MNIFNIKNKTIVVIGGLGKVGLPIVKSLLNSGAKVIVGSKNPNKHKSKISDSKFKGLLIYELDVSDFSSCKEFIGKVLQKSNRVDTLINSFSYRPMVNFWESDPNNWNESIRVNANGLYNISKVVIDEMIKSDGGVILNISSIYGMVGPNMNVYEGELFETEPDYPFLKSGTVGFTKYIASKFAKDKIRCNCLILGGVFNNQNKSFISKYSKHVPMGRMANDHDIVGPVIFLSSDASSYITGATLAVDGGWTSI